MSDVSPEEQRRFLDKLKPLFEPLEKYFRYEAWGLENIPRQKALVVINHGIIPFHFFLLTKKLMEERKIYPRGLGADYLFWIPGLKQFFHQGGAVNASPANALRLLKKGFVVLLAPGGIYEALIAKKGLRRIPWERRKGFVRIAIEAKAPIIPTYCRGLNSVYYNSYLFLKTRIKIFEKIRFSLPFFMGLGLLPFPFKLTHMVGKPISITKKKGETQTQQVNRIHREVLDAMTALARGEKLKPGVDVR